MSRFVRRSMLLAALAVAALPLTAVGSSAQEVADLNIRVGAEVVGIGQGPLAVTVDCTVGEDQTALDAVVNFDAQGHPTTASTGGWSVAQGIWVATGDVGTGATCSFTETQTSGAASTSFTCNYDSDPIEVPESAQIQQAGCLQAAGTGVGPVQVNYPGNTEVSSQVSTVVFSNVFDPAVQPIQPAAAVAVQPAFTG